MFFLVLFLWTFYSKIATAKNMPTEENMTLWNMAVSCLEKLGEHIFWIEKGKIASYVWVNSSIHLLPVDWETLSAISPDEELSIEIQSLICLHPEGPPHNSLLNPDTSAQNYFEA